jgi:hypothetical protein
MKDVRETSEKPTRLEFGSPRIYLFGLWAYSYTNVIDATMDFAESNETKHYLIIMKCSLYVYVYILAMFVFRHILVRPGIFEIRFLINK